MNAAAPTASLPVLLVDDEPQLLRSASAALRAAGIAEVIELDDSRRVLRLLGERPVGVIVLDLSMPHVTGQQLLGEIAAAYPEIPVIMMTGTNDLETAVACMKGGATDYLVKPTDGTRLCATVSRALERRSLQAELLAVKENMLAARGASHAAFASFVTQSAEMHTIFRYLEAIAPSPQPVLITGESGTGKGLIARALHELSGRRGALVTEIVAGLDDNMFNDTLFGHVPGSFTSAQRNREGLVHQAAEGTLFLDEIGDLSMASQVKLLGLLQDGTYRNIGSDQVRRSRARIIVATNRDVLQDVTSGRFRRDLYFRLKTHHVHLPPLRSRPADLPLLTAHFLERAAAAMGKPVPTVPVELYQLLRTCQFEGNARQLEAMCFDAVARHERGVLSMRSFKEAIDAAGPKQGTGAGTDPEDDGGTWPPGHLPTLRGARDAVIIEALRRAGNNQGIAAGMLGISRQAVSAHVRRLRRAGQIGGEAS